MTCLHLDKPRPIVGHDRHVPSCPWCLVVMLSSLAQAYERALGPEAAERARTEAGVRC